MVYFYMFQMRQHDPYSAGIEEHSSVPCEVARGLGTGIGLDPDDGLSPALLESSTISPTTCSSLDICERLGELAASELAADPRAASLAACSSRLRLVEG